MMKTVTVETLFGPEQVQIPYKPLRFKQIRAVMETLEVREDVAEYLPPDRRYNSPEQIAALFQFLTHEAKEYFLTLHLDGKNRIACVDCVSVGSLNQSIVHPREVFKTALISNAAALVLIHNHPSGDPSPSSEDIAITRRLKEAGDLLGIKVMDHVIIGTDGTVSLLARGVM